MVFNGQLTGVYKDDSEIQIFIINSLEKHNIRNVGEYYINIIHITSFQDKQILGKLRNFGCFLSGFWTKNLVIR
jgi:hypothetical protein